ncbi:hypothetical protein [Cecembia sp.]|uniref:hypothetical protein n=1 Tax=Cecembia sp. TaxID=1898110 RepID=UPI0025C64384|nr:hypothetical protein [Cecembia sp.]
MKTKVHLIVKNMFLMGLILFLFSACAKKISFQNSAIVPSAEGTVAIKQDKNNNYTIDLKVKRLAEPSRLTPPKALYVVWMETAQRGTQNLGQLDTSTKGFSNMLSSSLKTVSSHQPISFFITAEEDANRNYPGTTVVMKTDRISW